jgi:hypothetical protein
LVPDKKGAIFSTKILNNVSFIITAINSKKFSLKKTIWYSVMMFGVIQALVN